MLLELNRGSIFNGNAFLREKKIRQASNYLEGQTYPQCSVL